MSAVEDRKWVEELLPFFVNGTLSAEESESVRHAVSQDAELAADCEWLRQLQNQVRSQESGSSPGEFGLARLMRDVQTAEAQTSVTRRFASVTWGALAASVVAVAFVMSMLVGSNNPTFEQASGDALDGSVSVIFQPSLDVETLSAAVYDLGLYFVDGPSALGVYQVKPVDQRDLAILVEDLQDRSDLFEFVEIVE